MRLVRRLLWIVAIGAAAIRVLGLAHGFKGVYCFNSTHTCTSQDIEFHGNVVVWLAPLVIVICLWLSRAIKRYVGAQYASQTVTQRASPRQQAVRYADPAEGSVVGKDTGTTTVSLPKHAAPSLDSVTENSSSPRHAKAPESEEVYYEVTNLTSDERARLTRLLKTMGIPYSLSDSELLVDGEYEPKVDDIFGLF